jgi:hypothetical protein
LIVFITPEIVQSPEETEANIRRILEQRRAAMVGEYRRIFGDKEKSNLARPGPTPATPGSGGR